MSNFFKSNSGQSKWLKPKFSNIKQAISKATSKFLSNISNKLSKTCLFSFLLIQILMQSFSSFASSIDQIGMPKFYEMNLREPVTEVASSIFSINSILLAIVLIIFLLVFAIMVYSIIKFRKSKGAVPKTFHDNIVLEILWTLVPCIIVILIALPATKVMVNIRDTTSPDLTVKVVGYQWRWGYEYLNGPGEGIKFLSSIDPEHLEMSFKDSKNKPIDYLLKVDNPLVVPVNKKVRIITTANDVIHSFMVPSFGIKQDAIPGLVRDTWFRSKKTGDFYGQCAELCGSAHAYMPIHVKVLSDKDYLNWVELELKKQKALAEDPDKTWTMAELMQKGEQVYKTNCVVCHQANGEGKGLFKPLDGSKKVQGDSQEQIKLVLNGLGAMPSWKILSDVEIASVITFTKNSWSNKTGQIVQPSEVKKYR